MQNTVDLRLFSLFTNIISKNIDNVISELGSFENGSTSYDSLILRATPRLGPLKAVNDQVVCQRVRNPSLL